MIIFPEHCKVERLIAKEKIYSKVKASDKLKAKFVEQVESITWSYKLAPVSLHIPERDGINEIQIFTVVLRKQEFDVDVLKAIDVAIPFPIFFILRFGECENLLTGYKKIAANAVVPGSLIEYFASGWQLKVSDGMPLPAALDMSALYVTLFRQVAQLPQDCTALRLEAFANTLSARRQLEKEIAALQKKCDNEKQFDKRMELNCQLRELRRNLISQKT